jgi:hypothetical protein
VNDLAADAEMPVPPLSGTGIPVTYLGRSGVRRLESLGLAPDNSGGNLDPIEFPGALSVPGRDGVD